MNFKVGIVGLGYVGLPLYVLCKKKNIDTYGFDLDKKKIKNLKKNISTIVDTSSKDLRKIKNKFLFTMEELKNISSRNLIIFCLPTPVTKKNNPDMSHIIKAVNLISNFISNETILMIESTVYPGATREIFERLIKKKLKKKIQIGYGFSSERISPGHGDTKKYKIKYHSIPKVVSANEKKYLDVANKFYKKIFTHTYIAKSIEIAEMSKLLENSYRSVNIGLVNEFKVLCEKSFLNIHDVIDAAATKPFGFTSFHPGPGVGGHCIPIDPLFVSWFAKKNRLSADFIELARKKNIEITKWVVNKILILVKKIKIKKKNIKLLIVGMAYKEDINDYRESPSLKILKKFMDLKIQVNFYDPYVQSIFIKDKKINSIRNLNLIKNYDIVVLATKHSNLPYKKIFNNSKILVDTKGCYKNFKSKKLHFL